MWPSYLGRIRPLGSATNATLEPHGYDSWVASSKGTGTCECDFCLSSGAPTKTNCRWFKANTTDVALFTNEFFPLLKKDPQRLWTASRFAGDFNPLVNIHLSTTISTHSMKSRLSDAGCWFPAPNLGSQSRSLRLSFALPESFQSILCSFPLLNDTPAEPDLAHVRKVEKNLFPSFFNLFTPFLTFFSLL